MTKGSSMGQPPDDRNRAETPVRDRRYSTRFLFAAQAELLDMKTGVRTTGVTSDISLGGCFVQSSRPLPLRTRVRLTLRHKAEQMGVLATVCTLKPSIGMGLEFLDVEGASYTTLLNWLEQLRRVR